MPESGNNTKNVSVGKPKVGGAVYMAPIGTTLPETAAEALDAAFVAMGYISEDGVSNSATRTTQDIKDWGGEVVRNSQTEKKDVWKMKFIEALNINVLKATHGDENVTGTLEEGIVVRENAKELNRYAWVIDTILNEDAIKRIVIPEGKITEIADIVYKADEVIGYDATLTAYAYPEYDGDTHREFIQGTSSSDEGGDDEGGGDDQGGGDTDTLKALTVTADAGTESGTTAITVSPEKDADNLYVYKLDTAETTVEYGDNVTLWTSWDGESDIEAEDGDVITVVEATSDYAARGAGYTTVVVNA